MAQRGSFSSLSRLDLPPGAYRPLRDHWGAFPGLAKRMATTALVLLDARVDRLHPAVGRALAGRARVILRLPAGERAKSTHALERVIQAGLLLPRSGTIVCVGGGTLGDMATVAAHLLKRGLSLIHVPSTLLAAVDSSVGGKGALHSAGKPSVKNALGVFHYPDECWICPELFETLAPSQIREGRIEAWRMVASLNASLWRRYRHDAPPLTQLIRDARALKASVCVKDPYDLRGPRRVLNFGHTFGHALESLTGFATSHGDAVGMGVLCALDVGRRLGLTPEPLAAEVEAGLYEGASAPGREALAIALRGIRQRQVKLLLAADKKTGARGELQMVILRKLGSAGLHVVPSEAWTSLLPCWQRGVKPCCAGHS